jgi:eukaryotic-like serine/threonine-protein kinase
VTPERWDEVARVFGLAVDAPPSERAALLARECGSDLELRREVDELLVADAEEGEPLAAMVADAARDLTDIPDTVRAGSELEETGLAIGDIVDGRYEVLDVLGAGGMGVVVSARHQELDELVAIKLLKPRALSRERTRRRFLREARAAAKMRSPHVVRVRDVGTLENGAPFMVMDLLDGADLQSVLFTKGRIEHPRACRFVLQACEALATAHAVGVVHRDIKPANLFLERASHGELMVKLLDFGISKLGDDEDREGVLTRSTDMVGSPAYMSPEQLRSSRDVDPRADIWSLGVVLYQMLSGERPFLAESLADVSMKILVEQPTPLTGRCPESLEAVVFRCLAKERAERYADVGELAVALAPFCGGEGRRMARRVVGTLGGEVLETVDIEAMSRKSETVGTDDDAAATGRIDTRDTDDIRHTDTEATAALDAVPMSAGSSRLWWMGAVACLVALVAWLAMRTPVPTVNGTPSVSTAPRASSASASAPAANASVRATTSATATTSAVPHASATAIPSASAPPDPQPAKPRPTEPRPTEPAASVDPYRDRDPYRSRP